MRSTLREDGEDWRNLVDKFKQMNLMMNIISMMDDSIIILIIIMFINVQQ